MFCGVWFDHNGGRLVKDQRGVGFVCVAGIDHNGIVAASGMA